jgi:hypothetical protein
MIGRAFNHLWSRLLLVALVALVATGGALAYYTSTGAGSAAAQVGEAQAVTIAAAAPSASLYPGGSADVAVAITNPNVTTVHLPSLQLDTSQGDDGFAVDASHKAAGCTVSVAGLGFAASDNGGSGFDVPAKSGSVDGELDTDLPGAISMSSAAADACQGATFTVYLKVGA